MKNTVRLLLTICTVCTMLLGTLVPGVVAADKTTIQISAAISLKDALTKLTEMYAKKEPNVKLQVTIQHLAL